MSQNTVNNDIATQIANLKKSIIEHDIALNDLIKENIELEIRITKIEIRQIKKRQRSQGVSLAIILPHQL